MTQPFDPTTDPADALYVQLRDKAAQAKALTTQINALKNQLDTRVEARRVLLDEIKTIRDGLIQQISGVGIP